MRFDTIGRDVRFAFRLMRQTPVVSAVAMLSLALGIGANVAIFSLVNALTLKALPIHDPERLVSVIQQPSTPTGPPNTSFTSPQWEYLRDHQDFLGGLVATSGGRFNLNSSGELRPVVGLYANGSFFDVLGVTPQIGRAFTIEDDKRGGGPNGLVTVISYAFWRREYGGDPGVLGRTIYLDGHAFTVIGVTPPAFFGVNVGRTFDVATPKVALVNEAFAKKYFRGESPLGRTFTIGAPGSPRAFTVEIVGLVADAKYRTLREAPRPTMYTAWAQEEIASSGNRMSIRLSGPANSFRPTVLKAIEGVHTEAVVDFRTLEEDLRASVLQEQLVATLSAFFGGLALLLAAIGLYGVMSYSVTRRRGEIGIRMALGAEPRRVMRQVLGNVALIVIVGLMIGAGAHWARDASSTHSCSTS